VTPAQRTYLYVQNGVGAAIVNALLNGFAGWFITRGLPVFPVWAIPGAGPDLVGTAGGVAFGTCLVIPFTAAFDVRRGKITAPEASPAFAAFLEKLPKNLLLRACAAGIICVPVFAFPVLLALAITGTTALSTPTFVWVKTLLAALEGGLITPFVVHAALLGVRRAKPDGTPS
jgi:hypothetical protein